MTTHAFVDLPIGTRFVYNEGMWVKLTASVAQGIDPERPIFLGSVYYINPRVEVYTA